MSKGKQRQPVSQDNSAVDRRNFLKGAAVGAAALATKSPAVDAQQSDSPRPSALPPSVPEAWFQKAGEGYETARLVPTESEDDAETGFRFGVPTYLKPTTYLKRPAVFDDLSGRVKRAWPASWPGGTGAGEEVEEVEEVEDAISLLSSTTAKQQPRS